MCEFCGCGLPGWADAKDRENEEGRDLALAGVPVTVIEPLAGDARMRSPARNDPAVATESALSSSAG